MEQESNGFSFYLGNRAETATLARFHTAGHDQTFTPPCGIQIRIILTPPSQSADRQTLPPSPNLASRKFCPFIEPVAYPLQLSTSCAIGENSPITSRSSARPPVTVLRVFRAFRAFRTFRGFVCTCPSVPSLGIRKTLPLLGAHFQMLDNQFLHRREKQVAEKRRTARFRQFVHRHIAAFEQHFIDILQAFRP